MRRIRGARVCEDVRGRGNPLWMHFLKLGKVVDEIAEHVVVEKRVRQCILIQHRTVRGSFCRQRPSCNETCRLTKHPRVTYRIRYRIGYHISADIVGQPTISYIYLRHRRLYLRHRIYNLRYRRSTYDIVGHDLRLRNTYDVVGITRPTISYTI